MFVCFNMCVIMVYYNLYWNRLYIGSAGNISSFCSHITFWMCANGNNWKRLRNGIYCFNLFQYLHPDKSNQLTFSYIYIYISQNAYACYSNLNMRVNESGSWIDWQKNWKNKHGSSSGNRGLTMRLCHLTETRHIFHLTSTRIAFPSPGPMIGILNRISYVMISSLYIYDQITVVLDTIRFSF